MKNLDFKFIKHYIFVNFFVFAIFKSVQLFT